MGLKIAVEESWEVVVVTTSEVVVSKKYSTMMIDWSILIVPPRNRETKRWWGYERFVPRMAAKKNFCNVSD